MKEKPEVLIHRALDNFNIELPSWGFANTGTRFGKFIQLAAAVSLEDKFSDSGQVHALTGACPTMALHVQWDLPSGLKDVAQVKRLAEKYGVQPGSINPNLFQDQEYKYGSVGNPDPAIRKRSTDHMLDCVAIATALECRDVSPWFADGSNYPGTQSIRNRIGWFDEALKKVHAGLNPKQRLLIEYKPFEPAFYHTDVADWGMAFLLARAAGPQAYVLVDTGHHYQAQNIEQIVAWLLHHGMIGGFHFNDRRYADDDLTLGSIDPYQIFRIFHEIHTYAWETGAFADVAYMVEAKGLLILADRQNAVFDGEIFADEDEVDTGVSGGARDVDAANAGVRVRGAQEFAVRHTRKGNVISEARLAGNFRARVYASARPADYAEISLVSVGFCLWRICWLRHRRS